MDFEYIFEHYEQFIQAFWLTLRIGIFGILLAVFVGLVCAILEFGENRALKFVGNMYVELSRNTPLLIQIIFLYYALPKINIKLDSQTCGIVGLAFLGGSYMRECFIAGISSIEKSQTESALSLGLSKLQCFFYVILPQAVSVSVPGFLANAVFMLKETSVFSAIALADLMYVAKNQIGLDYMVNENLFMLVIAYLVLLTPILVFGFYLEKRLRFAGFGN